MRKIARSSAVALVALSGSAAVLAQPPMDFLGVRLGEPLTMEECPLEGTRIAAFKRYAIYVEEAARPCYKSRIEAGTGLASLPGGNGSVHVELARRPPVLSGSSAIVTLVDGAPESITAFTRGSAVQTQTLELLREKYGPPTEVNTEAVQNRMGASFDRIDATWELEGLRVQFYGLGSKIDTGYIVVSTAKGEAADAAEEAQRKAQQPKF